MCLGNQILCVELRNVLLFYEISVLIKGRESSSWLLGMNPKMCALLGCLVLSSCTYAIPQGRAFWVDLPRGKVPCRTMQDPLTLWLRHPGELPPLQRSSANASLQQVSQQSADLEQKMLLLSVSLMGSFRGKGRPLGDCSYLVSSRRRQTWEKTAFARSGSEGKESVH